MLLVDETKIDSICGRWRTRLPVVLLEPLGDAGGEIVEDEIIWIQANSAAQFGELVAEELVSFDDSSRTGDHNVSHRGRVTEPVADLSYGELGIAVVGLDVLAGDVRDKRLAVDEDIVVVLLPSRNMARSI